MKQPAIVIAIYAILILIGGVIGHTVAHSLASLISSSIIAVCLLGCCWYLLRGSSFAFYTALSVVSFLVLFFTYRYFMTLKIAPSGILALLSLGLSIYLLIYANTNSFQRSLLNRQK